MKHIQERVERGASASVSEVIREALREHEPRRPALRARRGERHVTYCHVVDDGFEVAHVLHERPLPKRHLYGATAEDAVGAAVVCRAAVVASSRHVLSLLSPRRERSRRLVPRRERAAA